MPRKPTAAQVIRCVAQQETLDRTRAHFPGLSDKRLRALLCQAAASLEAEPTLPLAFAEEALGAAPAESLLEPLLISLEAKAGEGGHSFVRIYSDGASRGNPGPAGAGAILTDKDGRVFERLGCCLGEQTNNQAEYEGALLGLRRARALGASEVELLADSQLLIRQLQGRYRVKSPGLLPLYREALELLAQFPKVTLTHIPREKNREADAMSNRAIDEGMGC
jgi:ribonuclease HI